MDLRRVSVYSDLIYRFLRQRILSWKHRQLLEPHAVFIVLQFLEIGKAPSDLRIEPYRDIFLKGIYSYTFDASGSKHARKEVDCAGR